MTTLIELRLNFAFVPTKSNTFLYINPLRVSMIIPKLKIVTLKKKQSPTVGLFNPYFWTMSVKKNNIIPIPPKSSIVICGCRKPLSDYLLGDLEHGFDFPRWDDDPIWLSLHFSSHQVIVFSAAISACEKGAPQKRKHRQMTCDRLGPKRYLKTAASNGCLWPCFFQLPQLW